MHLFWINRDSCQTDLTFGTFDPNITDENQACQRLRHKMPSPTYTLFRNAILAEQQVICSYGGRHRELCPHILGTNKEGEEAVLAWQFAGEVSSGKLPQWRDLEVPSACQCPRCPQP